MRRILLALALGAAAPLAAQHPAPSATYWAYVANESSDLVSRIRFGPDGLVEEMAIPVGIQPADIDGAHGIVVAPDGSAWYVSIAHGMPFGAVWKFEAGTERFVDTAGAGLFPASMGITPDGATLLVVNFNLHGDMVPSTVTAVYTPLMEPLTTIESCVMPHGGRLSPDGASHYHVCMMDDRLVEIGTARLEVTRTLALAEGGHAGHGGAHEPVCRPTWVAPAPDGRHLYVPCNGAGEVLEIDRATWTVGRRFATGRGPYNAEVSPDGRWLAVTLKGAQAVALFDLADGTERRIPTSQPVTHGVAITPDSRYAMVTNEGVGGTPGTVDVIALREGTVIASLPLHLQPGGIGFWRMTTGSR